MIGRRTGEMHRLGDRVEVKLVEAAPLAGALRFELLSEGRIVAKKDRPPEQPRGSRGKASPGSKSTGRGGKSAAGGGRSTGASWLGRNRLDWRRWRGGASPSPLRGGWTDAAGGRTGGGRSTRPVRPIPTDGKVRPPPDLAPLRGARPPSPQGGGIAAPLSTRDRRLFRRGMGALSCQKRVDSSAPSGWRLRRTAQPDEARSSPCGEGGRTPKAAGRAGVAETRPVRPIPTDGKVRPPPDLAPLRGARPPSPQGGGIAAPLSVMGAARTG